MRRPRILVVGANFAGIAAARAIPADLDVLVVDRGPSFEWLPNIHELVSRRRTPASLRADRRRMVARAGHRFLRAEVRDLDPARGLAVTTTGRELRFEACVVAVGGVHDDLGVRGASRHAMPFKSVADCDAIGRRLDELARRSRAPRAGGRGFTVAIVGGGIEGIECLGEILRRHRAHPSLRVHLVEAGPRLLDGASSAVDREVRAHCEGLPVVFHCSTRALAVTSRGLKVESADGRRSTLAADVVVWNAGARPAPLLERSGLAKGARAWAPVTSTLESTRAPGVFVAGDAASLPRPLSKQAYFALQTGEAAGANAARFVRGLAPRPFVASPKPMLLAFGDLDTFLVAEGFVLAGTALGLAKEAVLQATLATLDPPLDAGAALALGSRLASGLASALLPELSSPSRALALAGVRLLR